LMVLSDLGVVLLAVIFFLCGFALASALIALLLRAEIAKNVLAWVRGMIITAAGLSVVVLLLLILAFMTDEFSINLVRQHSSKALPFYYKISALWASPSGSLVFWSVAVFVLFTLWQIAYSSNQLLFGHLKFDAVALSIGAAICLVFTALLIFVAKPFAASSATVDDGAGLNPLLQNFWMILHPPLFFIAYAAFMIPFVVVLASVLTGAYEDAQIYMQLKSWLLFGICFLGAGIAAGMRWSYIELGWGGFWAWDPMENLSLLPWLIALAALHSLIGMRIAENFRFWFIILAPLPFILCLFATFIARTDVLQSVHSFVETDFSVLLLVLVLCCFLIWLISVIIVARGKSLSLARYSGFHLDKTEALFWANVVFIFIAVAVGIGTFWPVIWQARTSADSSGTLPAQFYNYIVLVAATILVLLIGCATLVDLQEHRGFILHLLGCIAAGLLCLGLVFRFLEREFLVKLACIVCAFSCVAVLAKLVLRLRTLDQTASGIAHLGLLLLLIAVCFSPDGEIIRMVLNRAEHVDLGKYELSYDSFKRGSSAGVKREGPEIVVKKQDVLKVLWPHNSSYPKGRRTAEVAVFTGLFEDIYVSFDGVSRTGAVAIKAKLKPFMFWVWLAVILIVAGTALGLPKKTVKRKRRMIVS